ncbi:hypothetical protein QTO34_018377, partial [Cnephaeus nilssonii]
MWKSSEHTPGGGESSQSKAASVPDSWQQLEQSNWVRVLAVQEQSSPGPGGWQEHLDEAARVLGARGKRGDSKNDSWIFALAVLLSSMFVYNSMSSINHQALEQLQYPSRNPTTMCLEAMENNWDSFVVVFPHPSYVTELTKLIRTKSSPISGEGDDSAEFASFFPDFVWVVRDFTLELELDGRTISDDQYLENALKLAPGTKN